MKIKDIVHEGLASNIGRVASSFGKALLPSQLQTTLQTLKANKRPLDPKERTKLEPEYLELAKAAHKTYGDNPQEPDIPGPLGWLTDEQRKAAAKKSAPTPAPTPAGPPSVSSPLHPDVQIVKSGVHPIMRYRGRDYERDAVTGTWSPLGGKKKASPGLNGFLNSELSKL